MPICDREHAAFLYSSDGGANWGRTDIILTDPFCPEPTVLQRKDGSVIALARAGGPDAKKRYLWFSESFDRGRTWSEAVRSGLPNPNSAVEVIKLKNGHWVLAYNDSQNKRTPLCLTLSEDEGRTWIHKRNLEDAVGGRFSYPSLCQGPDGRIHISYTFRRRSIKHVEVNEAWIMEGGK
jgi:predicted neuraminidase